MTSGHESKSSSPSSPSHSQSASPILDAARHKRYHSHPHVDTPYPLLEQSTTESSVSSNGSTGSFFEIQKHNYIHAFHNVTSRIPNPLTATAHAVEDHIAEFRYGHVSRVAKREARHSSQHSARPWTVDTEMLKSIPIPEADETDEQRREEDQKAWEAELTKRELARKRCDLSAERK